MKIETTISYKFARFVYHAIKNTKNKLFPPETAGIVYVFHRVDTQDPDKMFSNENMKISPEKLAEKIEEIQKYYNIIPSTEIEKYLSEEHSKPFAVITLDDGYKDNLTNGLPVFKKYNVPFTIFLTSDFIDHKAVLWWYILEDLLTKKDTIQLSDGSVFPCRTREEMEQTFLEIRSRILTLNQNNFINELKNLFADDHIDWYQYNDLALTWDEVETLKNEPLVTLGAHTASHLCLRYLKTEEDVVAEINKGAMVLQGHGISPKVFAFPYGTKGEVSGREIRAAQKTGIPYAFTCYGGLYIKGKQYNNSKLPREGLSETGGIILPQKK